MKDNVNHPSHYNQGRFETIEIWASQKHKEEIIGVDTDE